VDPARVWANAGARPGDVLVLTKRLGTGIVGTAIKFARAPEPLVAEAVASMLRLNAGTAAALAATPDAVHACTDVTGFGLIGHATEMARASGVTVSISAASVPVFEGVRALAAGNRSGGLASNRAYFSSGVHAAGVDPVVLDVCYDPQTSGGLLVALDPALAADARSALAEAGVDAPVIGRVLPAGAVPVTIEPE
jgi:selenide,water dikinase